LTFIFDSLDYLKIYYHFLIYFYEILLPIQALVIKLQLRISYVLSVAWKLLPLIELLHLMNFKGCCLTFY